MKLKAKHRYSGPNSKAFWHRVSKLDGFEHGSLYTAGILLQEMESRVLGWLDNAENAENKRTKRQKK